MEEKKCYLDSDRKASCTGCRACVEICPKKCIRMEKDEEGFFYPVIDSDKCINCRKCIRTCPVVNNIDVKDNLKLEEVYGYETKKEKDLLSASSGGAFSDIVKSFCGNDEKIAVFGVKFDENLKVVHEYVTNINDINIFKKSKYVQSNVGNSYSLVKDFLCKNYKVVFTGTPCQIAGLRKFLNKEYSNLLCVDIVCHGVPSQEIFDMALNIESKRYDSKIVGVNFREKVLEKNGRYNSKNIRMCFENGDEIIKTSQQSMYLKGFQNCLYYRPSCYECKFASVKRYSDITIADCWGVEKIDSNIDMHKGYSCIIIHTDKGKHVFDNNRFGNFIKLDLEYPVSNIAQYSKPEKYNKNRLKFYNNLTENNFESKVKKYTKKPLYRRILGKIRRLLKKYMKDK